MATGDQKHPKAEQQKIGSVKPTPSISFFRLQTACCLQEEARSRPGEGEGVREAESTIGSA